MNKHFDQKQRRKAEFMTPPNKLKSKAGSGGLSEELLNMAQKTLDKNTVDFRPEARVMLRELAQAVSTAKVVSGSPIVDHEEMLNIIMFPALQLKSNGAMFHFPLVTVIADRLVQFLEVIEKPDEDACVIIMAFHGALRAALNDKDVDQANKSARELMQELEFLCQRYFKRYGIDHNAE